jgi:hypothetical protein
MPCSPPFSWDTPRWAKFRLHPYTTATPHVRACSTGNSERLCPPIRFRCPGATILAFAINLRAGCMLVHASQIPKTFPLLHSILRRVASFRAKRISSYSPPQRSLPIASCLHDPNQLPDGSFEKPLLPLVPWHHFGPPACRVISGEVKSTPFPATLCWTPLPPQL